MAKNQTELEILQRATLEKMELLNKQMEELRLYYLAEAEKITGVPQKSPWKKNGGQNRQSN